ncbi:ABC-type Fe3+-hydroxamate transport system, periplasmic component [Chthonomonas calidirosea]|uniref:ABC-type Fe3+-hydroxamate transport system,periplasmic component n=1 Tax=Chthonomonas calidirosea (strain DSM 23976 / ICMP 18418 / T49) TaxID=1303518 RepID=S0EWJ4_CHTCT|nr:ABC transporter substrate-binding protein [Chthonomonas calidirosea]CCW35779.1 ABC-type Fe3+-hydroxamate transport system,periplasmic component [Chthonomonas calidirosea T49]CEK19266.1 ABC-type Fe3+-hydroxamate transport system, periplasmic component [Chthonomonas calidirosea]
MVKAGGFCVDTPMKRFALVILTAGLIWGIGAGCSNTPSAKRATALPQSPSGTITSLVDTVGHHLILKRYPQRIVSCAPSITEILYKLGLQNRLVLDTTACDYPPEAKQKPHFNALSNDIEPILAQNPDLVIDIKDLNHNLLAPLQKAGVPQLTIDVSSVKAVLSSILLLGEATGTSQQAQALVQSLQAKLNAVRTAVAKAPHRPRVLILYGTNPLYTTGPNSFINDLITIAGGVNVVAKPPPGNVISPEEAVALQPEVILCAPELVPAIRQMPGWAQAVPAVRNNRFFTAIDTLERPGPRMADAVVALARYLHPHEMAHFNRSALVRTAP